MGVTKKPPVFHHNSGDGAPCTKTPGEAERASVMTSPGPPAFVTSARWLPLTVGLLLLVAPKLGRKLIVRFFSPPLTPPEGLKFLR